MWDFELTTTQKANKDYHCDASDFITNFSDDEFSEEELTVIARARHEGFKILKGSSYTKTSGKWEGEFSTFRARHDLNKICMNHDAYEE